MPAFMRNFGSEERVIGNNKTPPYDHLVNTSSWPVEELFIFNSELWV